MDKLLNNKHPYDLQERLANLGEIVIDLVKKVKVTPINRRIIEQLVGSGGSSGANYSEAIEAESKRDFIHKIGIVKKELKETLHWLRLLARSNPEHKEEIRIIWRETHELLLIFAKIQKTSKDKVAK